MTNKKKNKNKNADFKKAKLKVGKKAVKANHTDLSFKTRSIVVPNQSVTNAPVSSKIDNLKSILSLLQHHSGNVRKDSLINLKEFLQENETHLSDFLSTVIHSVISMILDREAAVRKQVIVVAHYLSSHARKNQLEPFFSIIGTYTCSAMNHIIEEVRLDGQRFLNIWIKDYSLYLSMFAWQFIPSCVAVLTTMFRHGGGGGGGLTVVSSRTSLKKLAALDRVLVMNNICSVLHEARPFREVKSFTTKEYMFKYNESLDLNRLKPRWSDLRLWSIDNVFSGGQALKTNNDRFQIQIGPASVAEASTHQSFGQKDIVKTIIPCCIDLWLESASELFSGGMIRDAAVVESVFLVLQTVKLCFKDFSMAAPPEDVVSAINSVQKHILPAFPFGNNAVGIQKDCEILLYKMNLAMADIVSACILNHSELKTEMKLSLWTSRIFEFVISDISERQSTLSSEVEFDLLSESLDTLLPVAKRFMSINKGTSLIQTLMKKHKALRVKSSIWMNLFRFFKDLISHYKSEDNDFKASISDWILYLPKALWNLNNFNSSYSQEIIEFMSKVLREDVLLSVSQTETIQSSLIPYFFVSLPPREKPTQSSSEPDVIFSGEPHQQHQQHQHQQRRRRVFGPFLSHSLECQMVSIDLLFYLSSRWSDKLVLSLVACMQFPLTDHEVPIRLLEVAASRQEQETLALSTQDFLSLVLSVGVIGYPMEMLQSLEMNGGGGGSGSGNGGSMIIPGPISLDSLVSGCERNTAWETWIQSHRGHLDLVDRRVAIAQTAMSVICTKIMSPALAFQFVAEITSPFLSNPLPFDMFIGITASLNALLQKMKGIQEMTVGATTLPESFLHCLADLCVQSILSEIHLLTRELKTPFTQIALLCRSLPHLANLVKPHLEKHMNTTMHPKTQQQQQHANNPTTAVTTFMSLMR